MPEEIITLEPTIGTGLTLTLPIYKVMPELDWGDISVDPNLLVGPDVIGGAAGTRTLEPTTSEIPVFIQATTATAYVTAFEELADVLNRLSRGGLVRRQVDFGGGDESEAVAARVYAVDYSPEELWMQAHKKTSLVAITLERDPIWLGAEETLGTLATNTDAIKTLALSVPGNLPGQTELEALDAATQGRRYWCAGYAATQYQAADSYHYLAVSLTAGAAVLGGAASDAAAIGGRALTLAIGTPVPQEVGRISNVTNVGVYRIKARCRGSAEDASYFVRALWRQNGGGPWHEIGVGEVPIGVSTEYFTVDCGLLRNYLATSAMGTDTIDVRLDAYTDSETTTDFHLDALHLIPAEYHVVARGIPILQPPLGIDISDTWNDLDAGEAITTPHAPLAGGDITLLDETGDTGTNDWLAATDGGTRREGANDGTSVVANGQVAIFGTSPTNDYTNVTFEARDLQVRHKGGQATQTAGGIVVRYVRAANGHHNGLFLLARVRRKSDGKYRRYLTLYKFTGNPAQPGSVTVDTLKEINVSYAGLSGTGRYMQLTTVSVSVDTSGNWEAEALINGVVVGASGTDSALATAGTLETGRVGIYSLIQSDNETYAWTELDAVSGSAEQVAAAETVVVRSAGIGTLGQDAVTDAVAGGDQVAIPHVVGRLRLPPGSGELVTFLRRDDIEAGDPDLGYADSTTITVRHQPGWATLADALA
jgi:hypothetical protein